MSVALAGRASWRLPLRAERRQATELLGLMAIGMVLEAFSLVVAHRVSTVSHCDRLYRMRGGRIISGGPPRPSLTGELR